jgi:hypothetical protein
MACLCMAPKPRLEGWSASCKPCGYARFCGLLIFSHFTQKNGENAETIAEMVDKLEAFMQDLSRYSLAPIDASPSASVSPDIAKRVAGFNECVVMPECEVLYTERSFADGWRRSKRLQFVTLTDR